MSRLIKNYQIEELGENFVDRIAFAGEIKLTGNPAIAIEFRKFRLTYP